MIWWSSTTTICLARLIVERRCATITTVRPITALSIASCTKCSDSASRADVASSSNKILGLTSKAVARLSTKRKCWLLLVVKLPTGMCEAQRKSLTSSNSYPLLLTTTQLHSSFTDHSLVLLWPFCNEIMCICLPTDLF